MIFIDKEQQNEWGSLKELNLGNSKLWGVIIPLVNVGQQVNNPRWTDNNFFYVIQLQVKI